MTREDGCLKNAPRKSESVSELSAVMEMATKAPTNPYMSIIICKETRRSYGSSLSNKHSEGTLKTANKYRKTCEN